MLHGARVALRQAVLSAKFWPHACKHFCHARNIELREGQRAHSARFDGKEFDGTILPFGCLIDFFPTPPRKKTRRSQKDDVVLGDGEEYALPATDGELVDVEVGFDEDGNLEWIDTEGRIESRVFPWWWSRLLGVRPWYTQMHVSCFCPSEGYGAPEQDSRVYW